VKRGNRCPTCGTSPDPKTGRQTRRRQRAAIRWPRELTPHEMDAYGRGFNDGREHGYAIGRDHGD